VLALSPLPFAPSSPFKENSGGENRMYNTCPAAKSDAVDIQAALGEWVCGDH